MGAWSVPVGSLRIKKDRKMEIRFTHRDLLIFEVIDELGFATIEILQNACNRLLDNDTSTKKALQQRLSILKKQGFIKTMVIPDGTIYQIGFQREHGPYNVKFWQLEHEVFLADLYLIARFARYKVTSSRLCDVQKIENTKSKSVIKIPDLLLKYEDNLSIFFEYERTAKSKIRAEQFINSYLGEEMKDVPVVIFADTLAVYNLYKPIIIKLIKDIKSFSATDSTLEKDILILSNNRLKFIYSDRDAFIKNFVDLIKF